MSHRPRPWALIAAVAVLGFAVAILVGPGAASAHSAYIHCYKGDVVAAANDYPQGGHVTILRNDAPFASFDFQGAIPEQKLDGSYNWKAIVTAPDWPTFASQAGPCEGGTTTTAATTTTVVETTTTTPETTTTVPDSTTTDPTTTDPTTTLPTSAPPTTIDCAAIGGTSDVTGQGCLIPPVGCTGDCTPPSAPRTTLPRTGGATGEIALFAACLLAVGLALLVASRKR